METKKAKVLHAQFKREFEGKYGTMYVYEIEFDNEDNGDYLGKSKDQDKFKVGEEVDYTIEKKISGQYTNYVIKPISAGRGFLPKGYTPPNPKVQMIGFAMSYAKDILVADWMSNKPTASRHMTSDDLFPIFEKIYEEMVRKL